VSPILARMPRLALSSVARARFLGLAAALLGAAGISGVFLGPGPAAMKVGVAGVMVLALWRIGDALVVLAALGPLGGALAGLSGSAASWSTPLAFALVAGAGLRCAVKPRASKDPTATGAAAAWIALALASAAAECWFRASLDVSVGPTFRDLFRWLLVQYPAIRALPYGFVFAAMKEVLSSELNGLASSANSNGVDFYTTLPMSSSDLIYMFNRVHNASMPNQAVLQPPTYASNIPGTSKQQLKIDVVRQMFRREFGPVD